MLIWLCSKRHGHGLDIYFAIFPKGKKGAANVEAFESVFKTEARVVAPRHVREKAALTFLLICKFCKPMSLLYLPKELVAYIAKLMVQTL